MSSFPTCQVCHEQFSLKGPAPFLLPCLHAVCETCVTSAAGGVISCSPCQRDVNLTETPLQKDVVREKEILHLTVQHNPELVLCTHEEDGNQAVCWCKECEDFLCENCQMIHNSFKITKSHNVHDVDAMELGNMNEDKYCTVHPKLIADTWDKECCMLTCRKCRRGEHAGHEVDDVEDAAEIARNVITNFEKEIQPIVDKHREHLAAEENDLLTHEAKSIRDGKIGLTFNALKVQLDQKEKELQIELKNHRADVRDQLNSKKKTSETCHQRCQIASEYINKTLQYSSLHDVLELRQVIEDISLDCRRSSPSEDYKSLPLPVFNTVGLDRIKSNLVQFGTIVTEDAVPTNQMKDTGTQTEEDVLLKRLTKELKLLKTSEENLISEKKNMEREFGKEVDRLRKNVQELQSSEAKMIREKIETEKVSGVYRLHSKALDEWILVTCTHIGFSKTKYNPEKVHINAQGELINTSQSSFPYFLHRLKKYTGASSTVPLHQCGSTQYFEVKSRVDVEKALTGNKLLLEIGLTGEVERDQNYCIAGRPQSYGLNVSRCTEHGSICREVYRHDKSNLCLPDTLKNTPGTSATLHYGVVYDNARSRIAFLDVGHEKMIGKIDNVVSSDALWPMFGVYNPSHTKVSMSLVEGSDVDMTEMKKMLILDCLS